MIETKPYRLNKETYTKLVIKKRFKKSWWMFALMLVLSFVNLNKFGEDNFSTFIVIFGFLYPILVLVYLYFWSISSKNQPVFETMTMSFDNEFLYFKRSGSESKIPPSNITKVVSEDKFWMLYVQQGNFLYVQKDVFFNKKNYSDFCNLINIEE